ncbi:2-haloacid dehalogenase [Rhodovulum sulfidophilum]|uniref:HAD family hydrolase n=1 Tax=Rhodovulum sulfidophilum TaxID=35806 RepID=UPI0005A85454|nr:HAD family phosphatase [Rhodovulum sulfidophilum]ANB33100.1 haloacid dehalogenase [Rhodovulum sulfidophilum DSM 1374]ANB36948.1 haloacid dehalogenase [Rhodovulum sulfidophilum]MCW2302486.1 2-haloacid dehalogenase [Rhodovulum sulfidophilum]
MPIDAVVFDIGRVLIDWQPEAFYDRRIGPDRRRALFAEVDLYGMNEGVDRGDDFGAAVAALAARHPGWEAEIRMWQDDWLEMASPALPESVAVLKAVKAAGLPVFALSNFGNGPFEIARRAYPFFELFDRLYVSARLRVLKPDPRIYEILETDSGIAPERLIFTDDKAENIAAAAARGWKTHLFEGGRGWAARLVAEGVLDAADLADGPLAHA